MEKTCLFCHESIPDVSFIGPEKVSFIVLDPNEYCIGCHPGFTSKHPAGVDHLIEPSKKIMVAIQTSVQRIGVELPLYKGKIFCATCHNPHQEGVIKIAAAATGIPVVSSNLCLAWLLSKLAGGTPDFQAWLAADARWRRPFEGRSA